MATVFDLDSISIGNLNLSEGDRVTFEQGGRLINAFFENANALQGEVLDVMRSDLPEPLRNAEEVFALHMATTTAAYVLHIDPAAGTPTNIWRQPTDDLDIHGINLPAGDLRINDAVTIERPGQPLVTFTVTQIAQIETEATLASAPEGWRVPGVYRVAGDHTAIWLRSDEEATITNLSARERQTQPPH